MILPATDIDLMDIRNITGYPSIDLGTLCSCGEPYINKWSKYKPVIHSTIDYDTVAPHEWWKAQSGNCGLDYTIYNRLSEFITQADNETNFYRYEPPTGGTNSPYRLGDFRNYSTESQPPILANNYDGMTHIMMGDKPLKIKPNFLNVNEYSLKIPDIFGRVADNMYFGIALKQHTGSSFNINDVKWMVCEHPFTTSGGYVDRENIYIDYPIDSGSFNAGKYDLYQFLTPTYVNGSTSGEGTGRFVACPMGEGVKFRQQINFLQTAFVAGIYSAKLYQSSNQLKLRLYVDNTRGQQQLHFDNVRYFWKRADMDVKKPMGKIKINDFVVNARQNYVSSETVISGWDHAIPSDASGYPYYHAWFEAYVREAERNIDFGATGQITNA